MTLSHLNSDKPELQHFACGMFLKTTLGIYTWASDTLLIRHKLTMRDIVGKKDEDLPWALHARNLLFHDQQVLDSRKTIVFNETINRLGQTVQGLCHKSPVYDEKGQLTGVSGIFFDAPSGEKALFSQLSVREKQCLRNLAGGMTAAQSAQNLQLSRRTVEGYLEVLRLKLHCKNQSELVAFFYRQAQ